MRITWVLPLDLGRGSGGYAMVYGYANQLCRIGHDVTVVHLDPLPVPRSAAELGAWPRNIGAWLKRAIRRPGAAYHPDPAVRRLSTPLLSRKRLSRQDAVIATAWSTATPVANAVTDERGFYYIQHYEVWSGPADLVNATWHLTLKKIVIAEWLVDLARRLDALPVYHLPNAIDPDAFPVAVPPEDRNPAHVAMLWHRAEWKRSRDGLAALVAARARVPELTASIFSHAPRPTEIPDWIDWHREASASEVSSILNSAAIFISPSETEGWPLPPAEALSCGCALVSTDIGGVRDYAREGVTALLAPVGDVGKLADAVVTLARDENLRLALSRAGSALIRERFTWDKSTRRLVGILSGSDDVALRTD
jgi:glycosyltransferase involved in cell wall biosynthesis